MLPGPLIKELAIPRPFRMPEMPCLSPLLGHSFLPCPLSEAEPLARHLPTVFLCTPVPAGPVPRGEPSSPSRLMHSNDLLEGTQPPLFPPAQSENITKSELQPLFRGRGEAGHAGGGGRKMLLLHSGGPALRNSSQPQQKRSAALSAQFPSRSEPRHSGPFFTPSPASQKCRKERLAKGWSCTHRHVCWGGVLPDTRTLV